MAGATRTFSVFTFIVVLFLGVLQVHAIPASTAPTILSDGPASSSQALTVTTSLSVPSNVAFAQPTLSSDQALQDIRTIQTRRLSSIIGAIPPPQSIPAWYVSLFAVFERGLTNHRVSSLAADGKWPDDEVDYTTGCAARRANWPAQEHWQRIRMFSFNPFFFFLRFNLANIVVMAGAWHGDVEGGEQYVKDAALQEAIFNAMGYWFGRDIGTNVACLNLGGTSACPCSNPEDTLW